MRAVKVLLAAGIILFAAFLFDAFVRYDRGDASGHAALGAFAFLGAVVSLNLLSRGQRGNALLLDWLGCAVAIFAACIRWPDRMRLT
jgi:hypothetical protein